MAAILSLQDSNLSYIEEFYQEFILELVQNGHLIVLKPAG